MAEAFDYLETRDDADELIEEFGQSVRLKRDTASGPDYAPVLTSAYYATKAARVDFTWRQLQDETVLATDQRWLVAAGPLDTLGITDIKPTDWLEINGVAVQIVRADPVSPAGVVVMFDCQVRV